MLVFIEYFKANFKNCYHQYFKGYSKKQQIQYTCYNPGQNCMLINKIDRNFRKIHSTNIISFLSPLPTQLLALFSPHFKRNSTTLSWRKGGGGGILGKIIHESNYNLNPQR